QGAAGTLARGESVGMAFDERVIIAAAVEDESEIADRDLGAHAAVQARRKSDHVAGAIDCGDVTGVAGMVANTFGRDITRAIETLTGISRTEFEGRLSIVDQLAPPGSILFREQPRIHDLDVVHIVQIRVAV